MDTSKNIKYICIVCILLFTSISNVFAADNNIYGKWIEYVANKNTHFKKPKRILLDITKEHVNISDEVNSTDYKFSTKDNVTYSLYLDKNSTDKKIVKIDANMMLFYENTAYSPIIILRDGFSFVNKNKRVSGKWVYINKDLVSLTYDIGKNKITSTSSDDKTTDIFRFRYTSQDGLRVYIHYDSFYKVALLTENLAVMYITVPSNIGLLVRVLQKQSSSPPSKKP